MVTTTVSPVSAVPESTGAPPTRMGWLVMPTEVTVSSV